MTSGRRPVDERVAEFLAAAASGALPLDADFGSEVAGEFLAARRAASRPRRASEPVGSVDESMTPGGVRTRIYRPGSEQASGFPLLVYFHGGGWAIGDLEMHDATCRLLCARAGAVVVNVDYRLAPEHPFPAGLDDAFEATEWAMAQAAEWGADPARTVVAGTSAGGNLAAAVALRRRQLDLEPLRGMALLYPVLDARMATASYAEKASGYFLTAHEMEFFWDAYVQDDRDRTHDWLSPGLAADVHDFPPAVIVTAEHDPLRDEGNAFAARLDAEGLLEAHLEAPGQIHGFVTAFPADPSSVATVELVVNQLVSSRSA